MVGPDTSVGRQEGREMSSLIGSVIGGCRLEALLGEDGAGAVYRARHLRAGHTVALRLLAVHMGHAPDLRAAFHQEAQLAAMLDHPHIVRVFESGEWQDHGYLVMEFLSGGTLAALLARMAATGRAMSLALALDLARQMAEGLAYAHGYGVVHGDLRPRNLLLERDTAHPGRLRLKIGDFGLARLGVEMLAVGGLATPPLYLAPEQCRGFPPDAHSDIYSLGLVLYEALAGRPAFPGASYAEAVRLQLGQPAPSLRHARPGLPPEVEALVARCLARDPLARPADAASLAAELRDLSRPAGAAAA